MPVYETVQESVRPIGENGYVEVARRRLQEGGRSVEFVVVSRGFFAADGTRRWTKYVTLPDDPDLRAWIAEELRRLG